jgi:hypothetical protein
MDLLDALASNTAARSVVELSLSPAFRRGHASVFDAIDAFFAPTDFRIDAEAECAKLEQRLRRVVADLVPGPTDERPFWLGAVDALPISRRSAPTLYDRSYVHEADGIPGRRPVTIGHEYSLATALPPRRSGQAPWVVPLSIRRVSWHHTAQQLTAQQVAATSSDPDLPWHEDLVVWVADSNYCASSFLAPVEACASAVTITRLRTNRVLYHQPPPRAPGQKGRSRRYGAAFRLKDAATWGAPDQTQTYLVKQPHRTLTVTVQAWHDRLLTGKLEGRKQVHCVTVVRVVVLDQAGQRRYPRDLWLAVAGQRRAELTARQVEESYDRRFDQEHSHRFLRQRLLLDACQTPETQHEESWVMLSTLAYAQLFAARHVAQHLPRRWEQPPAESSEPVAARPTLVQRDFGRILAQLGTPARAPQRRGNAPGRAVGQAPGRRPRYPLTRRRLKAA